MALLLAGALTYWLLILPAEEEVQRPLTGSGQSATHQTPAAQTPGRLASTGAPAAVSFAPDTAGDKELLRRFNSSQSYRAFILDALRHPEWGGHQFAQTVVAYCRRYPMGKAAPAESSSSTRPGPWSFPTPKTTSLPKVGQRLRVYFDGNWHDSVRNTDSMHLAYDLATCNLGLDCGAHSFKAISLCAVRGFCGNSVADAIRHGVTPRAGARFEEIEKLALAFTAAVRQGNAQVFLPPQAAKKP